MMFLDYKVAHTDNYFYSCNGRYKISPRVSRVRNDAGAVGVKDT
jgi:hypothetical protein